MFLRGFALAAFALCACDDATPPLATAQPGVLFTYPADKQVDVPTGAHIVVVFSDPVDASALSQCGGSATAPTGGVCIVGPEGVVAATATVTGDEKRTVEITGVSLTPGGQYQLYVSSGVDPQATNLPSGALATFTARQDKPKSAAPTLVALNGGDPMTADAFRPMLETTTIELLFSEPLDTRSVQLATGSIELLDSANAEVPATIFTDGIHVAIDPTADLTANATYTLKLGAKLVDRSGQALAAQTIPIKVNNSLNGNPYIPQTLKTRQMGDPGNTTPKLGIAPNTVAISKPLIGDNTANVLASELPLEMHDPKAFQDGSIAFTIRKGARLRNSGLSVKLGGVIDSKLATGEIEIELLTDASGRMYRNPHQDPAQRPENERAPLYVDLQMDIAIYATDPKGNAVMSQTILGLTGVGVTTATDGVLDIEQFAVLDLGLLGVTSAPTNLALELITEDASSTSSSLNGDSQPPTLMATYPAPLDADVSVDSGIDLLFSEPIDLDHARNNGIVLQTQAGQTVPSIIESRGAALVIRPVARLAHGTGYMVVYTDVRDLAGNVMEPPVALKFNTSAIASTSNPLAVSGSHPGVGCALHDGNVSTPGRCVDGQTTDDMYHAFTLAVDQPAEVAFNQPVAPTSLTLGQACGTGSVRFEEVDMTGTCTAVVKGSLIVHERSFQFIPDSPWVAGKAYKMTLVSGNNSNCDANEICGVSDAASFDILNSMSGTGASGGPDMVVPFTGAPSAGATYMLATTAPFTDLNGDGAMDGVEVQEEANSSVMHITNADDFPISSAKFTTASCPGGTAGDGCLFISGAMPVEMQPLAMNCMLPDGTTTPTCMPVTISTGIMYGTSVTMAAKLFGTFTLNSDTNTSIMRVREPADGPVTGYIYTDTDGTPVMLSKLDLYMDAPDLSITLSSHDLHSKPISIMLKGPVTFMDDGRIAIALKNQADVPLTINVSTPLGDSGIQLILPQNQMQLQLLSAPLRGALP
ncbi:MAG: Ig-like domain-containing protein [Kofleriaceae bacterium]